MPRPRIGKRVCSLPDINLYGPLKGRINSLEIIMSVEEYEAIRLIDLEGLTQEECASKMEVARTTVQKLYDDARKKIAESIVNGNILRIEGGSYILYNETERLVGCERCRRNGCQNRFGGRNNDNRNPSR